MVNEADTLSSAAEAVWLDALEPSNLAGRCVIVFTTNDTSKLSQRFIDRCRTVEFSGEINEESRLAVRRLASEKLNGRVLPPESLARIGAAAAVGNLVSYRRVASAIGQELEALPA